MVTNLEDLVEGFASTNQNGAWRIHEVTFHNRHAIEDIKFGSEWRQYAYWKRVWKIFEHLLWYESQWLEILSSLDRYFLSE